MSFYGGSRPWRFHDPLLLAELGGGLESRSEFGSAINL